MKRTFLTVLVLLTSVSSVWATKYEVRPDISTAFFKLDHKIGFNSGFIKKFTCEIDLNEKKYEVKKVECTFDMTSVTSFNERRDELLKTEEFFDAVTYPTVTMTSKKIKDGKIEFEILAKDREVMATFDYRFMGLSADVESAKQKALLFIYGKVNRNELGVTYNTDSGRGESMLGEELEIHLQLQAVK